MPTITIDTRLVATPWLVQFIGSDQIARFGPDHPLKPISRLQNVGDELTVHETGALFALETAARAIRAHLFQRTPDVRLIRHLRNESSCRALLFEAMVLSLLVEPYVRDVEWRRYESAGSDIVAHDPNLQIECRQLRRYSLPDMLERVTTKRKRAQRHDGEGPFLLVVGAETEQQRHIVNDLSQRLHSSLSEWMGRHPEIAGIYFAAPTDLIARGRVAPIDDDSVSIQVNHFTGFAVRNLKATDPLPPDFEQNWASQPSP